MKLPFQPEPATERTRHLLLDEIAQVQGRFRGALEPGAARTFEWRGATYWVDRVRWLALPARDVEGFADRDTAPLDAATEDLLEVYGGDSRSLQPSDALDVLTYLVSGTLEQHSWEPIVTHVLNLVMVQPLVNPAIEPLFWAVFGVALGALDPPDDLMDILRPMTFDMSTYPTSRKMAEEVRSAQAAYVRERAPALVPAYWAVLDDARWAEVCAELVEHARDAIEFNLFEPLTRRAR